MRDSPGLLRDRQTQHKLTKKIARLLLDSGTQSLWIHRLAHALYKRHVPILPAIVRRLNIILSGADIHPGARLGKGVSIIHSVGIVIGKDVIVGDFCEIYGGVTLGGKGGLRKDDGHPRIGSNTVICSGAMVLGPISVGKNVTIAAGAVVLDLVPDNCLVAGVPAVVKKTYPDSV